MLSVWACWYASFFVCYFGLNNNTCQYHEWMSSLTWEHEVKNLFEDLWFRRRFCLFFSCCANVRQRKNISWCILFWRLSYVYYFWFKHLWRVGKHYHVLGRLLKQLLSKIDDMLLKAVEKIKNWNSVKWKRERTTFHKRKVSQTRRFTNGWLTNQTAHKSDYTNDTMLWQEEKQEFTACESQGPGTHEIQQH